MKKTFDILLRVILATFVIFGCVGCTASQLTDLGKELYDESTSIVDDSAEQLDALHVQAFNAQFQTYTGNSIRGVLVKVLLERVNSFNETDVKHSIKVEYTSNNNSENNIQATNSKTQLENLNNSIIKSNKYKVEISEYDKDGFINLIKITELEVEE